MATPFPNRGFLPFANPVSEWADPRRNALMGFSAGMLSGNPGGAMTGAMQGSMLDQQYARDQMEFEQEQESKNATVEWLQSQGYDDLVQMAQATGDIGAAWSEGLRRNQPGVGGDNLKSVGGHLYDTATGQWISPPESADNRQNISLTPQWARDAEGNPVIVQTSSTGDLIPANVPEGLTLMGPFDTSADKAAGNVYGKGIGGAQIDLPGAQLIAEQTIGAINDVRSETAGMAEHFGNVAGIPQQMTPAWPGSEKAQFQVAADRAINRAFLQGREMLKGGGQITDFESRKAEAAITAAQSALEKGDQQQFLKALDDFEQAVRDGLVKLQGQSQAMPGYGAARPQQAPAANGGTLSNGVQWSIGQ